MKQTTKTLVTLLVFLGLAAAAGGLALWAGKDEQKKAAAKENTAQLFAVDKAKARTLTLSRNGEPIAELQRADGGAPWKFSKPAPLAGAETDEAAVTAILDKLASLKQKAEVEGIDEKTAGLDKPKLAVSLVEEGGKKSALLAGEDNPFDSTTYVKREGDSVVRVISSFEKAPFEKSAFDLRDKSIAHLDPAAEVRRIEVKGTQVPYALEREGAGWKLLAPAGKADAGTAERIVSALKNLRATGIAAEAAPAARLREYGLVPPKISVKLQVAAAGGKDTFARTVLLGQPRPPKGSVATKTYARRDESPQVFEVDAQIVKDLDVKLFDLQDKSIAPFDREQVRRIEIGNPGSAPIVIARKKDAPPDGGFADESFEVLSPQKGPAKKWKVSGALYALAGLRAAAFAGPMPKDMKGLARFGLDKPQTVTLQGEGDKVLARLAIGTEAGTDKKRRYVHAGEGGRVAEVEKTSLDELPRTLADVLEAPPAPPTGGMSLPDGGVSGGATPSKTAGNRAP